MAMLKMEPAFAGYPQLCTIAGFVAPQNSGVAGANTIIMPSALSPAANANGAQLGPQASVLPYSSKVTAVIAPTIAYKPQVATNAGSGLFMLLDFSGFPGTIVSVQLQLRTQSTFATGVASAGNNSAVLFDLDQTNKFVYVGVLNSSGVYQNWTSSYHLMYSVAVIDSAFP